MAQQAVDTADIVAPKIVIEGKLRPAQDSAPPNEPAAETPPHAARNYLHHARRDHARRATRKPATDERPKKYQHFADTVQAAMTRNKLNASAVARRIWGVSKDRRGYDVAKNRDRIGAYLSGNSYPEPENLAKLAEAIGVTVEDLALPEGETAAPHSGPRAPRGYGAESRTGGPSDLRVSFELNSRVRVRGHIDVLIDIAQFQELIELLKPDVPGDQAVAVDTAA